LVRSYLQKRHQHGVYDIASGFRCVLQREISQFLHMELDTFEELLKLIEPAAGSFSTASIKLTDEKTKFWLSIA